MLDVLLGLLVLAFMAGIFLFVGSRVAVWILVGLNQIASRLVKTLCR